MTALEHLVDRLAADPSQLAELKTARALGISLKRFHGWEPAPGDEVEWDAEERAWMLALQAYEDTRVCPLCGMDSRVCQDEEEFRKRYEGADVYMCFASMAREAAMRDYEKSGIVEYQHSQLTKLRQRAHQQKS